MTGLAENVDHTLCCLDELTSHTAGVQGTVMRDSGVVMPFKGVPVSHRASFSPFGTFAPHHIPEAVQAAQWLGLS